MLNGRFKDFRTLALSVALVIIFSIPARSDNVLRITKEELTSMLGNPDVIILDVDREGNWEDRDRKILGAVRENPKEIESWVNKYPKNKNLVLY
jgi:predicted GTPase